MKIKKRNSEGIYKFQQGGKPLAYALSNDVAVLPTSYPENPWGNSGTKKYVIKAGETLSSIARNLTGSAKNYRDLALAAGIKDVNKIKAGDTIEIPVEWLMNYSGYKPEKSINKSLGGGGKSTGNKSIVVKPVKPVAEEIVTEDNDSEDIIEITPKVSRRPFKYRDSNVISEIFQYVPDDYYSSDEAVANLGLPFFIPGLGYIQDNRTRKPTDSSLRKSYKDENLNRALGRPDPFNLVRTYPELVKYQ